jgi:hypothetical protein
MKDDNTTEIRIDSELGDLFKRFIRSEAQDKRGGTYGVVKSEANEAILNFLSENMTDEQVNYFLEMREFDDLGELREAVEDRQEHESLFGGK